MCGSGVKRLTLNQQYLAALRQIAIVFPPKTSWLLSSLLVHQCAVLWVLRAFCHVCLFDQITKEINRKSTFATFCKSVFGKFQLVVWFGFGFCGVFVLFWGVFGILWEVFCFVFTLRLSLSVSLLSFFEAEEQSS